MKPALKPSRSGAIALGTTAAALALLGWLAATWINPPPAPQSTTAGQTAATPAAPATDWSTRPLDHDALLALLTGKITPDDARLVIQRALAELPDDEKTSLNRTTFASAPIAALCNSGLSEEAWAIISPDPGKIRQRQILYHFRHTTEPIAPVIHRLKTLTEPEERSFAIISILHSQAHEIPGLDFDLLGPLPEKNRGFLVNGFADAIQSAPDRNTGENPRPPVTQEALLRKAVLLVSTGHLKPGELKGILQWKTIADPYKKWDALAQLPPTISSTDSDAFHDVVADQILGTDVQRLLETWLAAPQDSPYFPLLHRAIERFHTLDPAYATTWLTTRIPADPVAADHILGQLIRITIAAQDFTAARTWAELAPTEDLRQTYLARIQAAEAPAIPPM